jgi:hypothetical protein
VTGGAGYTIPGISQRNPTTATSNTHTNNTKAVTTVDVFNFSP